MVLVSQCMKIQKFLIMVLPGRGPKLVHGMVLAIEPMVNIGNHKVKVHSRWMDCSNRDGSLSAHYENTVAILQDGPEILTLN